MVRSLRFQLVAIVVTTVATILALSQWLDTRFSERTLENDLSDRAVLLLAAVRAHWATDPPQELGEELATLLEARPHVKAVEIFRLQGDTLELTATTRARGTPGEEPLGLEAIARLRAGEVVRARASSAMWRVAVPLEQGGQVVGVAEASVGTEETHRLHHRLRVLNGLLLVSAVVFISLILGLFLQRRVTRPVSVLVDGMTRAARGELDTRVQLAGAGEFPFLARNLNDMLARLEESTVGLEGKVRQATAELAERNRELAEANEKLWQAQLDVTRGERLAALGQMAATIAHELGTPLNSILGYTQLLQREAQPPARTEKLALIESQVQRMIETIRSVLDRTRDRAVERTPVALGPLVTDALALVSSRIASRDVTVRSEVPDDLPPVPGDVVALRQVLLNLLTNAIDATEPRGAVTVSAAVLSPNGRAQARLELVVRDTGTGITPEGQRRLFEPFYTTKAPGRGTGLGLAIVDHIVRAHGGEVVVESVPGQGTSMRVRLPLAA